MRLSKNFILKRKRRLSLFPKNRRGELQLLATDPRRRLVPPMMSSQLRARQMRDEAARFSKV
jgi:hypothetical protein